MTEAVLMVVEAGTSVCRGRTLRAMVSFGFNKPMRASFGSLYALLTGIGVLALVSCSSGTARPPLGGSQDSFNSKQSEFKDVYDFCAPPACAVDPNGGLAFDATGALYGTARAGGGQTGCGSSGCGAVYKLTPSGSKFVESVPYAFCEKAGCADGSQPSGPLTFDVRGAIYGTAASGGNANEGVVFELQPAASGYNERVLYSFCPGSAGQGDVCIDGQAPAAGVILGKHGALYGTASGGSSSCQNTGCGVVFELTRAGSTYTENVIYTFCQKPSCADGAQPRSGLVMDKEGVLYGTTSSGGVHDKGTVFSLVPSNGGYVERVLYSFCHASGCGDGDAPESPLTMDAGGTIYGTTLYGGVADCNRADIGCGTAFALTPSGSAYSERVLHAFCHQGYGCGDGEFPTGLVLGKNGVLYGAATYGGRYADEGSGCGLIFKLLPAQPHDKYRVLYDVGANEASQSCWPNSTPVLRDNDTLYGTSIGSIDIRYGSLGTVWELQGEH